MDAVKYLGGTHGTFYGSGGASDVEIFPCLKELCLREMANLEEWLGMEVTGASSFFPRLTTLGISDCKKLTTMPHLPSVEEFTVRGCPLLLLRKQHFLQMNSLRELSIGGSSKLVTLLTEEEVRGSTNTSLEHLQSLDIGSCDELTSLSDELLSYLSSLKRLRIRSCKNLVGSFSSLDIGRERGLQLQHLTSLESLTIWGCEKLVCEGMGIPPCLQKLTIHNCTNIQSLPEDTGRITTLRIHSLPRLVSLPQLPGCLTSLKELSIQSCDNLASLSEGLGCLTSLETLKITGCGSVTTLPESLGCLTRLRVLRVGSEGLDGLTKLEELEIAGCPRLTSWPKSLQPQLRKLESLVIRGCPVLGRRCEAGGKYWHLVADIPTREIEEESTF